MEHIELLNTTHSANQNECLTEKHIDGRIDSI